MSTLKKIDSLTVPAVENSLALFDLPPTVVSYAKTFEKELLPLNTLTREGPYHFRIYSDSNFIDLSRTFVQMTTSIEKKADGEWVPIAETSNDKNTSVINNYGLSFIKQLKISINSVEVYNSGVTYPYYAYINREFFTPYDLNTGKQEMGCYYSDRVSNLFQNDPEGTAFSKRKYKFTDGRKYTTFVRLEFDLASQNRLMLSNSDIIFSIWSSSDRFMILAPDYSEDVVVPLVENAEGGVAPVLDQQHAQITTNSTEYRIKVHDIRMYCTLVEVVQSLNNSIAKQLEITPAKYPMRKIEIRTQFLPEGMQNLSYNCFQTILPRRVLAFFVNSNAFNGHPKKSPFRFLHGHVRSISLESGGVQIPSTPYMMDFSNEDEDYLKAYNDFISGMDMDKNALELSMAEYRSEWCGYCFDLRIYKRELGDSFELVKNGATVIKANFSQPVEEGGLMLLVWGEFDQVLTMSAERVVSLDGSI